MLTKQDLKTRYGDDLIFLFKGEDPFTEVENGVPGGCLIARESDGKILCYECNGWYENVGKHLRVHNMTAREYKLKYGLATRNGLCSKKESEQYSKTASKLQSLGYLKRGGKGGKAGKTSLQKKNLRRTCPAQYEERLKLLVAKFGKGLTQAQAQRIDGGIADWLAVKYGSWNKGKKHFNLDTLHIAWNRKQDAKLIYDLREYIKQYGEIPWKKDERTNGFPHSKKNYLDRWGSSQKVYQHCGIEKTQREGGRSGRRSKWEVID